MTRTKMRKKDMDAQASTPAAEDSDDFVEMLKAMAVAALIALVIRTFLFEPFNIPSGSMLPTLQVGDYLFVEKYSYGYSQYSFPFGIVRFKGRFFAKHPERGDIAVFRQPKKPDIDYIKRIIGLPGDKIQVKAGILNVNGAPAARRYLNSEEVRDDAGFQYYSRYEETMPGGVKHSIYEISDEDNFDDTEVFVVPEGHYFVMGDNRDSSLDSRAQEQVGFVPEENLIGRAAFLFFSIEDIGRTCHRDGMLAVVRSVGCRVAEFPAAVRYSRIFRRVSRL